MALEEDKSLDTESGGDNPPITIQKGRMSYNGLSVMVGQITEECNHDLRWPHCIDTYKAMMKDATVASTLSLMAMDISKVKWSVKIPEGYEEQLKDKAAFLTSCMDDMEHSWTDFIRQAASFNQYGFAAVEKVYRKRLRSNGSKHNDGLYGIRELPLIAQDTIAGWKWNSTGTRLTGLEQHRIVPKGRGEFSTSIATNEPKTIPRKKFMLFRAGHTKDTPIGISPLNSVYVAWRMKTEMEKQEALGVASDVRGLKVIYVPPQYLSESASEEEKQTGEYFKRALSTIHNGEQSGILLPQAFDDNNNKMFEFEVKSVMGTASHDIDRIISRYKKEIVVGLLAPMLTIGQDGSGSFALAEVLQDITATVVESRLVELRDQLNHDLIPQLFAINGWDTDVLPHFEFADVQRTNIDDWSSAIQRIASNGLIKLDAETVNEIHSRLGLGVAYDDVNVTVEDIRENATNFTSNASEGHRSPTGVGTATSAIASDSSTANKEN